MNEQQTTNETRTEQSPWRKTLLALSTSERSLYWSLRDCGDNHSTALATVEGETLMARLFPNPKRR